MSIVLGDLTNLRDVRIDGKATYLLGAAADGTLVRVPLLDLLEIVDGMIAAAIPEPEPDP